MRHLIQTLVTTSAIILAAGVSNAGLNHELVASVEESNEAIAETPPYTIALGMGGYSPVSYIEKNRAEPGSPRYKAEHDGITYFFTSTGQRNEFNENPERFLPAYGGFCSFGCSIDSKFTPDPTSFKVIEGKTHLFLKNDEVDARKLWNAEETEAIKSKADAFWSDQSQSKAYINGRNIPASGVGLEGFSPVSYFTAGKPEKGDARFSVEYNGVTYHLTSQAQVAMFNENPAKYEPQCGGWCAFGMSIEDKFPVDPTKFRVIDDELYLFLNNEEINAFDLWGQGDEDDLVEKARGQWKHVSGD